VIDDPGVHWSISPSQDISAGTVIGEWALEFSWDEGVLPEQQVGIYQSVSIPSCCVGPQLQLEWAILSPANTCTFSLYWNVILPSNPTGQIGTVPEEQYTISPDPGWSVEDVNWSFEVEQEFQVEMLLACTTSDPVWINFVNLGYY
jgi:hypothetical protein